MQIKKLLNLVKLGNKNEVISFKKRVKQEIENFIDENDWRVKENANQIKCYSALRNQLASLAIAEYGLNEFPKDIEYAHRSGFFHLHDLGYVGHGFCRYCAALDVRHLLLEGIKVKGLTNARPARHLSSFFNQIINYFCILSQEVAGATACSDLDILSAPFIREEREAIKKRYGLSEEVSWKYIEDYVKQEIQSFVYYLNYPNRTGGQSIFSNVFLTLDVEQSDLKNEYCIYGGKIMNYKYGELKREIDLFNRKFIEVMLEGDGIGKVFTFPLVTINITPTILNNISKELKDLIARASIEIGLFYFQNCINGVVARDVKLDANVVRSSCCRLLSNMLDVKAKVGGIFGAGVNTGSLSVVTLNLPRLGFIAKKDLINDDNENDVEKRFFKLLDILMNLARKALLIRRQNILKYRHQYKLTPLTDAYERPNFDTYFCTFGFVGLHECLINLGYENGLGNLDNLPIAEKILNYMLDKIEQYKKKDGILYNLEYVPAEGCSYRLAYLDLKYFGDKGIYISGTKERPYYNNSALPPVEFQNDMLHLLKVCDKLLPIASGGTVAHFYTNDEMNNQAFWNFIDMVCRTKIPYFTLSRIIKVCEQCGFKTIKEDIDKCPECGSELEKYTRVVGYLRPLSAFNKGKKQEFEDRKLTKIG